MHDKDLLVQDVVLWEGRWLVTMWRNREESLLYYITATGRVLQVQIVAIVTGRGHHIELDDLLLGIAADSGRRVRTVVVRVTAKVWGRRGGGWGFV